MLRKNTTLLTTLALAASGLVPAQAADGSMLTNVAMAPVKLVGLATSAIVGTPIAVTRYMAKESCSATKSLAGDEGKPVRMGVAALLGVPIGMFIGGVEGMYYGSANAYSKPFGKDSFSLGEIE